MNSDIDDCVCLFWIWQNSTSLPSVIETSQAPLLKLNFPISSSYRNVKEDDPTNSLRHSLRPADYHSRFAFHNFLKSVILELVNNSWYTENRTVLQSVHRLRGPIGMLTMLVRHSASTVHSIIPLCINSLRYVIFHLFVYHRLFNLTLDLSN